MCFTLYSMTRPHHRHPRDHTAHKPHTRDPLTRAMRNTLTLMANSGHPPLRSLSPPDARAAYMAGTEVLELPRAPLARVQDLRIPARDGALLGARLYAASHGVLPVLVYFHGGGFVIGSVDSHDILCRELARLSGAAVLSLDYRLAPEHPFPTAVHDAWDCVQWLAGQGRALGLDTTRIAVGGDSAGGNLSAVCSLLARDAGLTITLQMLFYPTCSALPNTPSHQQYTEGYLLDSPTLDWFFDHYLPGVPQRHDWRFAPLHADDHRGVAPAWIGLAECDILVDEGMAYADALRMAGVAVELEIYRGVTHEFIKLGHVIPEARQAHQHAATALKKAFHTH